MDETQTQAPARRPSGRDAKRASRAARAASSVPYITRKIPYYEVLGEEGLALLERNADTILEEVGIDFRDDPEALQLWREAGADVKGERVHFARGGALLQELARGAAIPVIVMQLQLRQLQVALHGKIHLHGMIGLRP